MEGWETAQKAALLVELLLSCRHLLKGDNPRRAASLFATHHEKKARFIWLTMKQTLVSFAR